MTCPACQHTNRDTARFCENCGASLARRCPACGVTARPAARFCDQCGHALAASTEAPPRVAPVASVAPAAKPAGLDRQPLGYTPRHLAEKTSPRGARSRASGSR